MSKLTDQITDMEEENISLKDQIESLKAELEREIEYALTDGTKRELRKAQENGQLQIILN